MIFLEKNDVKLLFFSFFLPFNLCFLFTLLVFFFFLLWASCVVWASLTTPEKFEFRYMMVWGLNSPSIHICRINECHINERIWLFCNFQKNRWGNVLKCGKFRHRYEWSVLSVTEFMTTTFYEVPFLNETIWQILIKEIQYILVFNFFYSFEFILSNWVVGRCFDRGGFLQDGSLRLAKVGSDHLEMRPHEFNERTSFLYFLIFSFYLLYPGLNLSYFLLYAFFSLGSCNWLHLTMATDSLFLWKLLCIYSGAYR